MSHLQQRSYRLQVHRTSRGMNGWTTSKCIWRRAVVWTHGRSRGNKALLRHCLGVEGQAQYRAIQNQPVEGANEYEKTIARLNKRFRSERGLAAARMEFANRRQHEGESIREYAAALGFAIHRNFRKPRFPDNRKSSSENRGQKPRITAILQRINSEARIPNMLSFFSDIS